MRPPVPASSDCRSSIAGPWPIGEERGTHTSAGGVAPATSLRAKPGAISAQVSTRLIREDSRRPRARWWRTMARHRPPGRKRGHQRFRATSARVFPLLGGRGQWDNAPMAPSPPASPRRPQLGGPAAVVGLAVIGLTLAGAATVVRLTTTALARPSATVTLLHVATGVAFLVVGALAAVARPRNYVGLLMTAVGLTWFVIDLQFIPSSVAFTVGNLFGIVTWAVLAQLVLAFPGGRLTGFIDRAVAGAGYAWMVLGNLLTEVLFAGPAGTASAPRMLFVLNRGAYANHLA